MNAVALFNFEAREVRVVLAEDGEPRWIAKDVAEALGYAWKGVSGTLSHVPEEWRGVCSVQTPSGIQVMSFLTEQGLYFFLGRSDKPGALPMQRWVAGKVLPAIRKTGSYSATPPAPSMPNGQRELQLALIQAEEEKLRHWRAQVEAEEERDRLAEKLAEEQPLAEFSRAFLEGKDRWGWREAAHWYGMGEQAMLKRLQQERVLYRPNTEGDRSPPWVPYGEFTQEPRRYFCLLHAAEEKGGRKKARRYGFTARGLVWAAERFGFRPIPSEVSAQLGTMLKALPAGRVQEELRLEPEAVGSVTR